jgi:tetratricopeptide (TPR) repeat protein
VYYIPESNFTATKAKEREFVSPRILLCCERVDLDPNLRVGALRLTIEPRRINDGPFGSMTSPLIYFSKRSFLMHRTGSSLVVVLILYLSFVLAGSTTTAAQSTAAELNAQAFDRLSKSDHAAGIALLTQAVAIQPEFAEAHANLGTAYYLAGRLDDAAKHLKTAIKLRPDLHQSYNQLGLVYEDMHRYGDAIAQYKRALRLKPDHLLAMTNLAKAYVRAGDYETALETFQAARRLDRQNLEIRTYIGVLYAKRSEYKQAIAELKSVIADEPKNEQANLALTDVYLMAGNRDSALEMYNNLKALDLPLANKMFRSIASGSVVNVAGW